jgi:hypothetical protein
MGATNLIKPMILYRFSNLLATKLKTYYCNIIELKWIEYYACHRLFVRMTFV